MCGIPMGTSRHVKTWSVTMLIRRIFRATVVVLSLSACGGGPPAEPVPDLHLPGVTRLAMVDAELAQQSARQFDAVAPYGGAPPGRALRLLALLRARHYDVGVDEGQPPELLDGDFPCTGPIAVSQDRAWAACMTGEGIGLFALPPAAPTSPASPASPDAPPRVRLALPNTGPDDVFYSPTWGPGGRSLAVLRHRPDKPDEIAVYAVPPAHDALHLTSVLQLAGSVVPRGISWSPDGRWLSVSGSRSPRDPRTFLLPARTLPAPAPAGGGKPAVGTLDLDRMGEMSLQIGAVPGWRPSDGAATFVRSGSVVTRDSAGGSETTLLRVPGGTCARWPGPRTGGGSSFSSAATPRSKLPRIRRRCTCTPRWGDWGWPSQ